MAGSTVKELIVKLGADISDFEKKFGLAFKTLVRNADKFKEVGEHLTKYVTLPILALGAAAITMAAQEEKAFHRVGTSLKLAGVQWEQARQPVLSYIAALSRTTEFDGTAIAGALNTLTITSGNAQASVDALSVTLDIAASGLMDLDSASKLVGKALGGNTDAFKRYGINIAEGSSATQILTQLTTKFAGSSTSALQTVAGAFANTKNRVFSVAETLGGALQPVTLKVLAAIGALADQANRLATWFSRLSPNTKTFVAVLALAAAALGPGLILFAKLLKVTQEISAAMKVVGITTGGTIASVLFLAGVALVVAANWEKTKNLLQAYFYGILTFMLNLARGFLAFQSMVAQFVPGIGTIVQAAKDKLAELADTAEQKFIAAGTNVQMGGGWIANTIDMVGGKVNEALVHLGALQAGIEGVGNAPPQVQAKLTGFALFFSNWAAQLKKTASDLAQNITNSIGDLAGTMATQLAQGSLDAKEVLMGFLTSTLQAVVTWAVQGMLAASGLSAALTAAFANPLVAVGVIAGLIALVAGLSASFKAQADTAMASGGMTTGPTRALIGDNRSGEEAVLPLDNPRVGRKISEFVGGGGGQTIIVELDGRVLAQATVDNLPDVLRLQALGA